MNIIININHKSIIIFFFNLFHLQLNRRHSLPSPLLSSEEKLGAGQCFKDRIMNHMFYE